MRLPRCWSMHETMTQLIDASFFHSQAIPCTVLPYLVFSLYSFEFYLSPKHAQTLSFFDQSG